VQSVALIARLPLLEIEAPESLDVNLDGEPLESRQLRFSARHYFRLRNKRSIGELSQQLPRRLMLCSIRYRHSPCRNRRLAYCAYDYQALLRRHRIVPSHSRCVICIFVLGI
jgi:hypothetical protein